MKNKTVKALALAMTVATVTMMGSASIYASDDTAETATEETAETTEAADGEEASDDQAAADEVAALIDKIYVQERNDTTDEDCKAAKEAWDKLTDAPKKLIRITSVVIQVMHPKMILVTRMKSVRMNFLL